jgi:histidyl-tRNA synthetase
MTQGSGLMFKVVLKDQTVIATGGRFESLLKRCGKKIGPNLSAVDISFKVENILELLKKQHSSVSLVDVAIRTKNKETAIPVSPRMKQWRKCTRLLFSFSHNSCPEESDVKW